LCALLRCPWLDGPGIVRLCICIYITLARSPFVCAFMPPCARLVLWRRRSRRKLFLFFFCARRKKATTQTEEFLKRETTRSIDRSTGTFTFRRVRKVSSFFEQKSRSFFFGWRENNAHISKTNFSAIFCFSFTFRTLRAGERETHTHTRKPRREEEEDDDDDDDDDDEFKSTDERARVYHVHLHGRDDEKKKKISKQSRGCSFESDE